MKGSSAFSMRRLDTLGTWLSIGCAIHCAATPMIALAMAASGLELLRGDGWHSLFLVVTSALAVTTVCCGWRKHRKTRVLLLLGAALACLLAARSAGEGRHEEILTAVAGLLFASCHRLNTRCCASACSRHD
jgi:hypothetical protein